MGTGCDSESFPRTATGLHLTSSSTGFTHPTKAGIFPEEAVELLHHQGSPNTVKDVLQSTINSIKQMSLARNRGAEGDDTGLI